MQAVVAKWVRGKADGATDCTEFCGTGFQPVKKNGQDGRATLLDTKFGTVPGGTAEGERSRIEHTHEVKELHNKFLERSEFWEH